MNAENVHTQDADTLHNRMQQIYTTMWSVISVCAAGNSNWKYIEKRTRAMHAKCFIKFKVVFGHCFYFQSKKKFDFHYRKQFYTTVSATAITTATKDTIFHCNNFFYKLIRVFNRASTSAVVVGTGNKWIASCLRLEFNENHKSLTTNINASHMA